MLNLTEEQLDIACASVQFAINNKVEFDKYLEFQGHKNTIQSEEFMNRVRIVISDELHQTR